MKFLGVVLNFLFFSYYNLVYCNEEKKSETELKLEATNERFRAKSKNALLKSKLQLQSTTNFEKFISEVEKTNQAASPVLSSKKNPPKKQTVAISHLQKNQILKTSSESSKASKKFYNKRGPTPLTPAMKLEHNDTNKNYTVINIYSTNTLDPNACGRTVGLTTQKQTFIPNPDLEFLPKEDVLQLTKNIPCEMKTGLIYMLEKAASYDTELNLVLIYIRILSDRIEFYQSKKRNSLFHQIKMQNFIKIGQRFKNTTCFEIVSSSEPVKPEDLKNKFGDLTLCTLNVKDERIWVRDLMAMKECTTGGKNILADYNGVNSYIQKLKNGLPRSPIIKQGLFYSNGPSVYDEFEPIVNENATSTYFKEYTTFGKAIENIHNVIKNETLKEEKVKKDLAKQLDIIKKNEEKLREKKDIIQRLIESRLNSERLTRETTIQFEKDRRAVEKLKKVEKAIKKVKETEIEQVKRTFNTTLRDARLKSNLRVMELLNCIKNEKKNLDPQKCIDEKALFNFEDTKYINGLCFEFYGEAAGPKCSTREHFCKMCCGHYIGIDFLEKLDTCNKQCTTAIRIQTKWRARVTDNDGTPVPSIEPIPNAKWRKKNIPNNPDTNLKSSKKSTPLMNASGRLFDADNSSPVPMKDSKISLTSTSDKTKSYVAFKNEEAKNFFFSSIVAGGYELNVEVKGYVPYTATVSVTQENASRIDLLDAWLSKTLEENEYKAIINWVGEPSTISPMLVMLKKDNNKLNTLFDNIPSQFASPDGQRPMAITFKDRQDSDSDFFIKNDVGSSFSQTNMVVRLIQGSNEISRIEVPKGDGAYWHVFSVSDGKVRTINAFKAQIS